VRPGCVAVPLGGQGPYGKRSYRKRVIGAACPYADVDSARRTVTDY
jgi:hypothetical protein